MALLSGGILVLMWILGHGFSGHYNRLALISVDIISGVCCINLFLFKTSPSTSLAIIWSSAFIMSVMGKAGFWIYVDDGESHKPYPVMAQMGTKIRSSTGNRSFRVLKLNDNFDIRYQQQQQQQQLQQLLLKERRQQQLLKEHQLQLLKEQQQQLRQLQQQQQRRQMQRRIINYSNQGSSFINPFKFDHEYNSLHFPSIHGPNNREIHHPYFRDIEEDDSKFIESAVFNADNYDDLNGDLLGNNYMRKEYHIYHHSDGKKTVVIRFH